jgi:glucosamine-6-phosphate deaminase
MNVVIRDTRADAVELTAAIINRALTAKAHLVLGLATGRTMESVYDCLARMHHEDGLDFSLVRTFNLDEYVGLPLDHPASYHSYMRRHLFDRVNLDPRNTNVLNGMAEDLDAECRRFEDEIRSCNGIDLQLLGIGHDGHIGFNEPLSALQSRTREKALTPDTMQINCTLFDDPDRMPRRALTMGVGTILECRRCVLLATGPTKADIIAKAVEGPITAIISATALQFHPNCTVILDQEAAVNLQHQDYYRWVFDNEPEWEPFR